MATVKTKAPTGMSIARKGNKFTATWKLGDKDYNDGQICKFRCNNDKTWTELAVGVKTTARSATVDFSKYFPTTSKRLHKVWFGVRGNRKSYTETQKINGKNIDVTIDPTASDWTYKEMDFIVPSVPTATAKLSDNVRNETTFTWKTSTNDTSRAIFRDCEWQTVLVKNSSISDGSKIPFSQYRLGWEAGTGGANGSKVIREDTELLASNSYARWFRVRSRGVAGVSAWRYARHVYARPNQAVIKSAKVKRTNADGYSCTVKWSVGSSIANPIDIVTVQYGFAVPDPGMVCPDAVSWTDAGSVKDTSGMDALTFSIDQTVGLDQCLFVRVNTKHDDDITYGTAAIADVGRLSDPSGLVVSTDDSTYRATVAAVNSSTVEDSFLEVRYVTADKPNGFCCGIIPHGEPSVNVQCPDWSGETAFGFKVRTVVGSYEATPREDGVSSYAVTPKMKSVHWVRYGGAVPQAPSNVALAMTDTVGTVQVTFDWAWQEANFAELSWADHEDAWESTDEPSTYNINSTHASRWNISGLEAGKTWYVRVRLASGNAEDPTYGAYSETESIDLSSAPVTPVLTLSNGVITEDGEVTASWVYVSTDTTTQQGAEVAEIVDGNYVTLANLETAQYVTISAEDAGWATGEEHILAVRVTSASGRETGWSDPVSVFVAEPIECTVTQTSLESVTVTVDGEDDTFDALTEMPLTVTVTGAGEGLTTVSIVRAETYHISRPDESDIYAFEGETVATYTQTGEAQITIDRDDLIGRLDDGAAYTIIATIQDGLGQMASAEVPFRVMWDHQAEIPNGTVTIDTEHLAAMLVPVAPQNVGEGDTCDIYRLSVDKPQLVYSGATYGETYVDPYPAVGQYGGYRFVMVTADGDYVTDENELAWTDIGADVDSDYNIIDFDGGRVMLRYNPDVSNKWAKDFKETKYLGGSVQGDWNPAVSRSSSVNSVAVAASDRDVIEAMRRLATHSGICHVRTKEGSSYSADVQVSESYAVNSGNKLANFSLSITRIDPDGLDGMTLAEWQALHREE